MMRAAVAMALLALLAVLARAGVDGGLIFRDGFEPPPAGDGDALACLEGPAQVAALGPLPAGERELLVCFTLSNDRSLARAGEIAYGGVPVPRSVDLDDADLERLLVAGPGAVRLPAQFAVLSRWGDTVDSTAPVRWLQIAVPADVAADDRVVFALLRYAEPPAPADDPLALAFAEAEGHWILDTGLAVFELDPDDPSLFHRIAVRAAPGAESIEVFRHQPGVAGFGPVLRLGDGAGGLAFEAGNGIEGSLVLDAVELRELGPVQAVVVADGHFRSGDERSRCPHTDPSYESLQWTLELRFGRGQPRADLFWVFRNACSDASNADWLDDAIEVLALEWGWPMRSDVAASGTPYFAGLTNVVAAPGTAAQPLVVEQRRGGGTPWQRRARVHRPGGQTLEQATSFERPLAGLRNDRVLAAVHMPWMRYREPQALVVEGDRLAIAPISAPIVLGEGKGVWFPARLNVAVPGTEQAAATRLQAWREAGFVALERGLLPHVATWNNAGEHWPPLAGPGDSALSGPYRAYMERHHDRNVTAEACTDPDAGIGGQWDCAKTYGAQLWPDVQFDEQFGPVVNATPAENLLYHNYWNPSGSELLEFLRSGEPRWVWDFALPQTWLQIQTAALNLGAREATTRNGFVVTSTGNGDGHWHRSGSGSDDYNYNRGQYLAFALRPNQPMRDRFAAQGATMAFRYDLPREQQEQRDFFLAAVRLDRGPMQHFEALANCAEFVPGVRGAGCRQQLAAILHELAHDNLSAGVICDADVPENPCFAGQQFMVNSMFYTFLLRMLLNYGDVPHDADGEGILRRALVRIPRHYRDFGMAVEAGVIDPFGTWSEGLECTLDEDRREVLACADVFIESGNLFFVNRPQTLALLLMSDWLQPDPLLCQQARAALAAMFPDPSQLGPLAEYANGGWWKGAAQVTQSLAFGVGLEQRCAVDAR